MAIGASLIQTDNPESYLNSFAQTSRSYQADQEWREMNYALLEFSSAWAPLPKLAMLRWVRLGGNGGIQYTKSSLKLVQKMHNAYKVGANGIKEFGLPSGKRIDFLDIQNDIIHKLKPFNPRAVQQGHRQLNMYSQEIHSPATLLKHPEFRGINWKTVLDTY
jgi:hypothetical protein